MNGKIAPKSNVIGVADPVYASQWPLPDTTQDSVRGCRLSFTAVVISGDMVSCAFKAQPARTARATLATQATAPA